MISYADISAICSTTIDLCVKNIGIPIVSTLHNLYYNVLHICNCTHCIMYPLLKKRELLFSLDHNNLTIFLEFSMADN